MIVSLIHVEIIKSSHHFAMAAMKELDLRLKELRMEQ